MEDHNVEETLKWFEQYKELTPLQRAILSSTSTVQTMLSAIFEKPVIANLISQMALDGVDIRWVQLSYDEVEREVTVYSPAPGELGTAMKPISVSRVVCMAESVLPRATNSQEFLQELRAGRPGGIGVAISKLKISTERVILGIFCDENVFTRTYRLKGDGVDIIITEVFPNNVYDI